MINKERSYLGNFKRSLYERTMERYNQFRKKPSQSRDFNHLFSSKSKERLEYSPNKRSQESLELSHSGFKKNQPVPNSTNHKLPILDIRVEYPFNNPPTTNTSFELKRTSELPKRNIIKLIEDNEKEYEKAILEYFSPREVKQLNRKPNLPKIKQPNRTPAPEKSFQDKTPSKNYKTEHNKRPRKLKTPSKQSLDVTAEKSPPKKIQELDKSLKSIELKESKIQKSIQLLSNRRNFIVKKNPVHSQKTSPVSIRKKDKETRQIETSLKQLDAMLKKKSQKIHRK